ncbi:uncharacterized protein LOC105434586 isoform X2 [Cucumis sativus]|uniref:uncharacterized protein LOC105434586 isoform X2 n=1 Tax=Cucumis sativus TaxID=3659 RepID=UPI0012F4FFEB|nr:uncharacterized protein LOC105434586 isoform X2 [Cucumis sativus]
MSESLFKTLFNMVSEHTLSSKIFWWPNSVHTLPLKPSAARMTTPTINVSHTSPKNQENPNSNQSDTSAQTSFDQNQGYLNPYFLHHNDNTNLVLVTEQLTEENYVSWSRAMTIGLSVKNKIGFVDGTIARPTGDLLPVWIRNNNIVISWILNSVSKPISANILFSDLARTIWVELKERFQKKNAPRIFQLKRSLATLSQNQDSIGTSSTPTYGSSSIYKPSLFSSPKRRTTKINQIFCLLNICNGIRIDKCYKIHGYPPGYRTKQQQQRNNNAVNSVTIQNDEIAPQGTTELTSNPKINNTAEALIQCQNLLNQLQCQIKCFQSTNCLSCSRTSSL